MKKHKFKVGDVGYVLLDGEIFPATVTDVIDKAELVEIREGSNCSAPFFVDKIISPHWAIYFTITEDRLFSTPKELINNFTQLIQNHETN